MGWYTVATGTVRSVQSLLELLGGTTLRNDPKYATQELQMLHREELGEMVRQWFAENNSWILSEKTCASMGVVAARIFTLLSRDVLQSHVRGSREPGRGR